MAKALLLEEFHLSFTAPRRLAESEGDAARRTLSGARFRARLSCAIRDLTARFPTLAKVRVAVTR
jgi:hypothetical protein